MTVMMIEKMARLDEDLDEGEGGASGRVFAAGAARRMGCFWFENRAGRAARMGGGVTLLGGVPCGRVGS